MKLVRFDVGGKPQLGAVRDDAIVPVTAFPTMLALIEAGAYGLARVRAEADAGRDPLPLTGVKLLAISDLVQQADYLHLRPV
jgi:hypothetical protein